MLTALWYYHLHLVDEETEAQSKKFAQVNTLSEWQGTDLKPFNLSINNVLLSTMQYFLIY